ncbi:hypothetical protein L6452_30913 [Arctium lappa]|uniref:Uncharacterized protein n=1 Tax=Arctium lappa TaxID=4217 RepID=A0ACB8ZJZ2_ARCLA|nr:hypothetical protein L6452_30913 [Arctium lappa]
MLSFEPRDISSFTSLYFCQLLMDPEAVISLFDSCWFNYEILKKNQSSLSSYYAKVNQSSSSEPKFSSLRSILVRSHSEDIGNSFNYGSFSPNSVLFTPHLKSIPSGNLDFKSQKQEQDQEPEVETANTDPKEHSILQQKKKNKKRGARMSKSLSDLEFDELKGFMDLGFVFSEEDKDSSLVEIIPGLQRLGEEREGGDERESDDSISFSSTDARRPYLSEAWKDLDRKTKKREQKPALMMNWEVPALSDEIDMKDNLKLWAHTVASIVR